VARITIIAGDAARTVRDGAERIALEPGDAVVFDRAERQTRRRKIITPGPLKPSANLIARTHEETISVGALSDRELAKLTDGELRLELLGKHDFSVGQLDRLADQADQLGFEVTVVLSRRDD
jgi:hypothetical protein